MKYIFILMVLLVGCKTFIHKNDYSDDIKILNVILKNKKIETILFNKSLSKNPDFYLNSYNKWKKVYYIDEKSFKELNGEVNWIFSKKEIKDMIKKYRFWEKSRWNINYIVSNKVNFIPKIPKIHDDIICKISQPLYNKTKLKALVFIEQYEKKHVFTEMLILKKENKKWIINGIVFISYY